MTNRWTPKVTGTAPSIDPPTTRDDWDMIETRGGLDLEGIDGDYLHVYGQGGAHMSVHARELYSVLSKHFEALDYNPFEDEIGER